MLTREAVVLDSAMLDEAKAYLRLETDEEDAPLGAIILAAIGHAEATLNYTLLQREVRSIFAASPYWRQLGDPPVGAITAVIGVPAEGARFPLPVGSYAIDIDGNGAGWVRVTQPGSAGRIEVVYQAGLVANWAAVPEAIRLGILRLVGHLYTHRDESDDAGPPAAVAALLRPWRRTRLS